jgi:hypothetical protein
MSEIIELRNPFSGCHIEITNVKNENRISRDNFLQVLNELTIHDENEFYLLFTNGLLIKKERSKFRTSNYLQGEKFKPITNYYEEV